MKLCFYPPQQPRSLWASRTFSRCQLAGIFVFQIIFAVLVAIPSLASSSAFPDFPPSPPASTGAYSAKLPSYTMESSPVAAKSANTVLAKPMVTNAVPHTFAASVATNTVAYASTDPVDTNAVTNISTNPMDALNNVYQLATGDTINFQVLEDKEDSNDSGDAQAIVVTDAGDVQIRYVGLYPAVGKTCRELARQLQAELEKKYYYQATVIISVKSMTSKGVIYVMGGVHSPGPQELPRDEVLTVSKAILRAGGFDDFADQKHVQVTRKENGTNAVFIVNVSAILDKSKINEDRDAQPGDFIYVPEKVFRY